MYMTGKGAFRHNKGSKSRRRYPAQSPKNAARTDCTITAKGGFPMKTKMKTKRSLLAVMLIVLTMLAGLARPCSAFAATSCTKGVVYQNGLEGISISINKAPYNTIFIDARLQSGYGKYAY
jgi:hypothetical protein